MTVENYKKLLAGGLGPEEERAVIDAMASTSPKALPGLCLLLAEQRRQLQAGLAKLTASPWYPADVLRRLADGRVEVAAAGRRQVVEIAAEVDAAALRPGDEVFLSREQVVVALGDAGLRPGLVGTVIERAGAHVVLRGVADEEIACRCAPELADRLRAGDRVLYLRESQLVLERLPERTDTPFQLERAPAVTFADIGGLEHVIADIRRDLDLHLRHPERARAYRLAPLRGILLLGPPGTGKTLIAKAIANHLDGAGTGRFLHVKPGALRGVWYGESERRIEELFAGARRAPGLCVLFFDELDHLGTRGVGVGQDIDGRVLGRLLTEIDGLESRGHILLVGATNRLDLCDDGLVRPGRFGDRQYQVSRPGREAARQIFAKYLAADLPYAPPGDGAARAAAMIEAAVAYLYAPRGGAGLLATVTLATGERREVLPPAVVSGALIASAVERAKLAAAACPNHADGGLTLEEMVAALEHALAAEAEKLRTPHAARRLLDFPGAEEIVRVELPAVRRPRRHRYLRVA